MNVVSLFCLVLVGVFSSFAVREASVSLSGVICLATAVISVVFLLPFVGDLLTSFDGFISNAGLDTSDFTPVLKAVGTGYLAEFVADLCERCGEKGLASKIETAERIYIVTLCLPVIFSLSEWFESICA